MPLVADISSCILSRPIDVSRFGVLYAGAQKNVAPAGLTIVIIREDLIGEPQEKTPTMFMYKTHAESDSSTTRRRVTPFTCASSFWNG